jgi:hypothetical protein
MYLATKHLVGILYVHMAFRFYSVVIIATFDIFVIYLFLDIYLLPISVND